MSSSKSVTLQWEGQDLHFSGRGPTAPSITIDGNSKLGPSPVDVLLLSLCGCMGADICSILEKSRVPFTGVVIKADGDRAESHPRRLVRIRLDVLVEGVTEEDDKKMERALALSEETYCSVLHSLREDIEFDFSIRRG